MGADNNSAADDLAGFEAEMAGALSDDDAEGMDSE